MIAVFCKYQRDFEELHLTPKKLFIRIHSTKDIHGRTFIGVIRTFDWYNGDRQMMEAYDVFEQRFPELFKK